MTRPSLPEEFVARIDGSTATIPLTTAALRLLRGTEAGLHHNTTDNAYMNLIAGDMDVIFVTAPSPDELEAAEAAGVELEVIPVVKDALVFLANTDNPVTSLTRQQIKDIYTGKLTNWNQVGGPNSDIIPYQRPLNSGSQTLFLQLAMADTTPMDAPQERRPASMGDLVDAVSLYDNSPTSLGFSVFYYAQQMYTKDNVKLIGIDGVVPDTQSISAETYPYLTYYYAVVRADEPTDSLARQLIDWLLTWEGQQIASSVGYVPLSPDDIVEIRDQYGYYGSTAENTTRSSGTGGPVGTRPDIPDPCYDPYFSNTCLSNRYSDTPTVSIPGHEAASAAANAWIASLPPAKQYEIPINSPDTPTMSSWVDWQSSVVGGLFSISRQVQLPQADVITEDSAIFSLADGHRVTLSELFYDGVNYIEFINRNLLNSDTNQLLADCVTFENADYVTFMPCSVGELTSPFSGLPSDYEFFTVSDGQLTLRFPVGNPFLSLHRSGAPELLKDSFVRLNLPADLSPYGLVWRWDRIDVPGGQIMHIVRNLHDPSPADDAINIGIDALLAEHPDWTIMITPNILDGIVTVRLIDPAYTWFDVNLEDPTQAAEARFDYATGQRLS